MGIPQLFMHPKKIPYGMRFVRLPLGSRPFGFYQSYTSNSPGFSYHRAYYLYKNFSYNYNYDRVLYDCLSQLQEMLLYFSILVFSEFWKIDITIVE